MPSDGGKQKCLFDLGKVCGLYFLHRKFGFLRRLHRTADVHTNNATRISEGRCQSGLPPSFSPPPLHASPPSLKQTLPLVYQCQHKEVFRRFFHHPRRHLPHTLRHWRWGSGVSFPTCAEPFLLWPGPRRCRPLDLDQKPGRSIWLASP